MSVLKLQGALFWRAESLWIGLRKYSSAKVKEEARKRWVLEQAELLEVLEARVKQLQTEVGMDTVPFSRVEKSSFFQPVPPWKALSPTRTESTATSGEQGSPQPSRWMEKLNKEKSIKHKRLLRLEAKLARVSSNPGVKPIKPTSKRTQGPEDQLEQLRNAGRKAKLQPLESGRGLRGRKKAAVMSTEELEKGLPDPPLPLEEDNGHQLGNLQLSILSYMDTCLFLRQPEKALQCLAFYHRSHARRKLLDVRMYNLVLHEYAKKRTLSKVGSLFRLMEESGVKPNQDSYIAALSCMGRSNVHPNIVARCLQQLEEDGFRPEELFQNYMREGDEVEMALEGIRKARPGFQLPPRPREAEICTIPLLQDFYKKENPVSYPKLDFTAKYLRKQFRKQLAMEASDTVTIDSVEAEKPLTEKAAQARSLLAELRSRWRASLLQSLQESKLHLDRKNSERMNLYPFLCVLNDKEYVDILMRSLSVLPPHGESLLNLARELGTKVYNKYVIRKKSRSRLVEKIKDIYDNYVQLLTKDTQPDDLLPREHWEKLASEAGWAPSRVSKECVWPHSVLVQLGLHLVELLVQVLKMESNILNPALEQKLIPVLYHVYSFRSGHQIGFIRPHPILTRLLLEAAETTLSFEAFVIPMLCPPVPWVSPHFGAYVFAPTKLMRYVEGALQHQILLDRCPSGHLHPVMDALNQLGNCPWKVNGPILDVVVSIFNDKGDENLDIPPPPSEAPQPATGGALSKAALKREVARCRKKAVEMYSLRMDALYKLSIAKHMRDGVFWFPHNMDFRGRTYPCPPHFNHLGSDLTRALLLFAEGRPLGAHGLDWLKIHLINLTGLKKRNSLRERLAYANEIMADILDSADHPLMGRKWWMNTDEPWQALACCMEIAKATRAPDPAAFVSHFPVHQDGSCNGLQHYAALGRDVVGAASVNLTPCDVPQDVYSVVAQQVEVFRKRDAAAGVKTAQLLEGFIGRKVVKQTVMTVVYGVTRYGGRLQIEKRLKEMDDFPQEYVWEASHYLVQQVFSSLKEMFSGTREIQGWLTDCARLIAKSGRTVEWVTPLGLPIIQPYHRSKNTMVNSSMQTVNLRSRHDINQKPDTVKQKNAFPPNFIHSLDSTHMMLTSLHCHRQGLTFVSVHDCYWTHALTVDVMNRVCRDQFVALHSQPILESLSRFMLEKYCARIPVEWKNKKPLEYQKLLQLLCNIPKKGDFDLEKVKESTYFFS